MHRFEATGAGDAGRSKSMGATPVVFDLICIAATVAFFGLTALLGWGLQRVGTDPGHVPVHRAAEPSTGGGPNPDAVLEPVGRRR